MVINITEACNEMCTHCMMNAVPEGNHMSIEVLKATCNFIKKVLPLNIAISGGEFTLMSNFEYYVQSIIEASPNSVLSLLSNGSFIDDPVKCDKIIKLLDLPQIHFLQVRTHPDYYPNYDKTMGNKTKLEKLHSKIQVYNDKIDLMPFGRALINHKNTINWNRKPACSNPFLIAKQFKHLKFNEFVMYLQFKANTFCKPDIFVNGDIYPGETQHCLKMGTVFDTPEFIMNNFKTKAPCNKCGLVKNYNDAEKAVIFN